jgi:hypothetical protein
MLRATPPNARRETPFGGGKMLVERLLPSTHRVGTQEN